MSNSSTPTTPAPSTTPSADPITVERVACAGGAYAIVRLNRPSRMNALSAPLVVALSAALVELASDGRIRAVVLTGAGERAFCAGADLKERAGMSEADVYRTVRTLRALTDQVAAMPKPVVAAINGYAFGGGLELALAADLRLASANAIVGLTETRLGIIPGAGGTQRLPRIVGVAKAKELIYCAKRIDAAEARTIGLVSEVFATPAALIEGAGALAEESARAAPLALREAKFAIDAGADLSTASGLDIESRAYDVLIPTRDRVEALTAFAAKRPPEFEGR